MAHLTLVKYFLLVLNLIFLDVEFTLGGVSRTSKKKEKTLNPVWDEEIPTFVNFMENDNLGITIFDSNVIEKAKFSMFYFY